MDKEEILEEIENIKEKMKNNDIDNIDGIFLLLELNKSLVDILMKEVA